MMKINLYEISVTGSRAFTHVSLSFPLIDVAENVFTQIYFVKGKFVRTHCINLILFHKPPQ
jgi:hypothetical protein